MCETRGWLKAIYRPSCASKGYGSDEKLYKIYQHSLVVFGQIFEQKLFFINWPCLLLILNIP